MVITILILITFIIIFFIYASANINSGIYLKAICKLKTNEKTVALTFDDGPDSKITPQVLNVLAQYNIKALFFCIGNKIKGNEELIKRIVEEGHILGNHSYNHKPTFPLFSASKMKTDIEQCNMEIIRITREKTNLFRPPFGVTNPTIAKIVRELKYKTIGWNIRSFDTIRKQPHKVAARVNRKLKPGSIILLHDNTENITQILEEIINFAQKTGYKFIRADQYI